MTFRRVLHAWDRFLFQPVSPVPIALYRIGFGILVILNLVFLLPDLNPFFGEQGMLPMGDPAVRYLRTPGLNVLAWLPHRPFWLYALISIAMLAAVCLTVGLLTRFSAIVVFVCLASLHFRNPLIINSGDAFLRIASFYLMFSAAGRAISLDRWLRVRRGTEPPGEPAPVAPWAQRLIQIQLAIVYLSTVHWKLQGPMWVDGTAVYYAIRVRDYYRFPVPYLFDHLWTIKLMTWGTLLVEFAMGALVWFRDLRYPVLLAGLMLHLGLEYSMNIQLFQWVMLSAFVLFIEPRDLRRATQWLATRRRRRRAVAPSPPTPLPAEAK
jgi:hypothetical protein